MLPAPLQNRVRVPRDDAVGDRGAREDLMAARVGTRNSSGLYGRVRSRVLQKSA